MSENRLATVADGTDTWAFTYDDDGMYVKEIHDGRTDTISKYSFAGGAYEIEVDTTVNLTVSTTTGYLLRIIASGFTLCRDAHRSL